jgi:hypothetical protein
MLREMTLVRLRGDGGFDYGPFKHLEHYLYLGEIKNMRGHGVFASRNGSGYDRSPFDNIHYGWHIDSFEEVPEDES